MPNARDLLGLLERGPFLMFDSVGQYRTLGHFEDDIVTLIADLISRGHERRITTPDPTEPAPWKSLVDPQFE
jgi:hypothetical protein